MLLEYFQMIDHVEELDPENGTILARSDVPMESPVFEGHFPGTPLVPGVLLIETMAQASGFMLLSRLGFEKMPFLANVTEAKMRSFVEPGAALMVKAELEHDGSGFAKTRAEISAGGKKICESRIMFRVMPFPNETLKGNMLDRFSQISRSSAE